jgi:hypothetical protein
MRSAPIMAVAGGLFVLAALPLAYLLPLPTSPPADPHGVVEPAHQRVEVSTESGRIEAVFRIRNLGGRPLTLGAIQSSCGCASVDLDRRVIAPGQEAIARVVGSPPAAGERIVEAHIETNSKSAPRLCLRLTVALAPGTVPYVSFAPASVRLNDATIHTSETFTVEALEWQSEPPWLERLDGGLPGLATAMSLESEHALEAGVVMRRYRCQVHFIQKPPVGPFRGEFSMVSRTGKEPVRKIDVSGEGRPPIRVTPAALYGSFQRDDRLEFRVLLQSDRPGHLAADATVEGADLLQVERIATESEGQAVFRVKVTKPIDQPIDGSIVFRTNHPEAETIRVPVRCRSGS